MIKSASRQLRWHLNVWLTDAGIEAVTNGCAELGTLNVVECKLTHAAILWRFNDVCVVDNTDYHAQG